MPTAGLVRTHRASIVSDAVPGRIARAGAEALQVQSVYRSVMNVATADGLLTVASPAGGGLPNGILADLGADWRTIGVEPGMPVLATNEAVDVPDAGIEIRIGAAPRWSPRFRTAAHLAEIGTARWRGRATTTRAIARGHAAAGSFGTLLADGRDEGPAGPARAGDDSPAIRVARAAVAPLVDALAAGDRAAAAAHAARLIGLGPGLTPSGDDVLVGIEAALHALARPTAGFLAGALDDVETQTTELAATFLRHAAAGEFAERLHALLAALLWSDDATIPTAIDRAVAWGATSGSDCLVGVLIGLDVAAAGRSSN